MKIENKNLFKILLFITISILSLYLFSLLKGPIIDVINILIPFIVSFALAFIVQPYINFLENKGIRRNYAIFIIIILILIIIVTFFIFLVPLLEKELYYFIDYIPQFITNIEAMFNQITFFNKIGLEFKDVLELFFSKNNDYMTYLVKIVNAIFSTFIPTITTPILIVYFIVYYDKIENYIKKISFKNNDLYEILKQIKLMLHEYFRAYFIITSLLFIISSICFAVLKIDYFIIWGIIIGITNIIPYVGPYIGGGIVGLFVFTTQPELLLYVIIIIVCLQLIESNFLTPKIQGRILQINPILVVFSVTIFGKFLGIIGMIIAVPIIRIIQIIFNVKKNNKKR